MSALNELQQLLTVPPPGFSGNSHNPAAVALAALQALRDAGDERFLFLRTVLELSSNPSPQNEEILFHCLTGCRHVMLHKWNQFSLLRDTLRDFLLCWALQTELPRTVEIASYTTSASFWKRQWNDSASTNTLNGVPRPEEQTLVDAMRQAQPHMHRLQSQQELFQYMKTLLQPTQNIQSAAKFLSVLVGEFMGKSAVQYHLPLEFHKRAHGSLEKDGWLDQCLQLSMGALSHIVTHISSSSTHHIVSAEEGNVALAVVQLTIDVMSWEFGADAWDSGIPHTSSKTLIRPPKTWRDYLIRPDFIGAVFHLHERVVQSHSQLAHALRQLLLLLASLSGPIFVDEAQRKAFATYLVDGALKLVSSCTSTEAQETSELLDVLSLVSRLIANFKLSTLVQLPTLVPLLSAMSSTGTALLQANVKECEEMQGDVESMEHREWREEALNLLLDGIVLLCDDPWRLYSGTEESRKAAQQSLAQALGPLYNAFVSCRICMARLEEHYLTAHAAELDEVREEISALDLEDEMASVAVVGRLNPCNSLSCLSSLFQSTVTQLRSFWEAPGITEVTPEGAAVLEETRLLTMCIGHLLTDDNSGETPVIPESFFMACRGQDATTSGIVSAVTSVLSLAELQASCISRNPSDPRLSPLLAAAFLWYLNRWAPAYVHPVDYGTTADAAPSQILSVWSTEESSQQVLSFCATLCLHYQCHWPQERQVQEGASSLILALGKRGNLIRAQLLASPSLTQMLTFHCLTAGIRHNAPPTELEAVVQSKAAGMLSSLTMIRGYHRLRYEDKAQILTALLVTTCDLQNETAKAMFQEALNAVHTAFSSLVQALTSKQISPDDVHAKEMACLCVELYGGVARASEIDEPERIPVFLTPSLPHLSGLMSYESYAKDLTVCEGLLRFFRDYTEQFVAMLDRQQSLALFQASAELLKSYSVHHCSSRVIKRTSAEADAEEEQQYSDVLCAIQLLIHLGTKDFLDICTANIKDGVDSNQVTDVIFFGLQQIIPLMTQGLLQFPTLCTQYFSLVGFMLDTYPDKVCVLPYELFDALLESMLFGMSHLDSFVSKSSLQGIAGLTKEHLKSKALDPHLAQHPDIFDKCSSRLLKDVVFQSIVWDRLEPCGMALLPLAAVDVQRFGAVVHVLQQQLPAEHQPRLQAAFERLIQAEVLSKVASGGYEGRMNRIRFKKDFEEFVKDVHSFLVLK